MAESNLKATDIVHFEQYFYTDKEGGSKNRFSVIVLPSTLSQFQNSIYCCIVTKSEPKNKWSCYIKLEESDHDCFSVVSFCCFDRMDMQSRSDLSNCKQPVGQLTKTEVKCGLKQLQRFLFGPSSKIPVYLRAAIVREWKMLR